MATFLLEVGTEELPASFVGDALQQWQTRIAPELTEQCLEPESIRFYGTPAG
jgi:glycyl-tRNA synthetase beta chain